MTPPNRTPPATGETHTKASSTKNVLAWLKKAIGFGSATDHGRRSRRFGSKRHHHHVASTHRARVHSFVQPCEPTDAPHPLEEKRQFHTTGSKYTVTIPADDTATTKATSTREAKPVHVERWHHVVDLLPSSHVLIVGASLSGLCLAQGLKRAGIPFTVFQGDAAADDPCDGYHVHLDTTGYEALRAMLPDDTFELLLRSAGQAFPDLVSLDAATGKRRPSDPPSGNTLVFSVNRSVLRAVLLHGLEAGSEIQYKRVFQRYHVLPNKTVEVHFANGLFVRGSLLVGADGRASRVREQYVPSRSGGLLGTDCSVIYGKTRVTTGLTAAGLASTTTTTMATSQTPPLSLRIEPLHVPGLHASELASASTTGSSRRRMGYRYDDKADLADDQAYVCWSMMARTDQLLRHGNLPSRELDAMAAPHAAHRIATRATAAWHPLARAIIETASPESCSLHRLYTAPLSMPEWTPSRVTLIGDAAHAMIPSATATNLALQDATVLCERLVHLGVSVPAVAMYEKLMRLTARDAVLASVPLHRRLVGMPPLERMAAVRADAKPRDPTCKHHGDPVRLGASTKVL